jgi:hypothetical protein
VSDKRIKDITNLVHGIQESGFSSMDNMWPTNQHSHDVQIHGRPSRIFQILGRGVKSPSVTKEGNFPYFHWSEGQYGCLLEISTWNGGTPFEEYVIKIKGGANLFVELGACFRSEWELWYPKKYKNFEKAHKEFYKIIEKIEKSKGLAYTGFPKGWYLKFGDENKIVKGLQ